MESLNARYKRYKMYGGNCGDTFTDKELAHMILKGKMRAGNLNVNNARMMNINRLLEANGYQYGGVDPAETVAINPYNVLDGHINRLGENVTGIRTQFDEIRKRNEQYEQRIATEQRENEEKERTLTRLRADVESIREQLATATTDMTGKIKTLEDERTKLNEELTRLRANQAALVASSAELERTKKELESQVARVADLDTKIRSAEQEKNDLTKKLADEQKKGTELNGQIKKLQAEKAILTAQVTGLNTRMTNLVDKETHDRLQAEVAQLKSEKETTGNDMTRLTAQIAENAQKIQKLTADLEECRTSSGRIQAEGTALQNRVKVLENDKRTLEKRHSDLEQTRQKENADAQQEIQKLRRANVGEITKVRDELTKIRDELRDVRALAKKRADILTQIKQVLANSDV